MKKTLEEKVRKAIRSQEKNTKEKITELHAYSKRAIGFKQKEEIVVTYYTK